MEKIYTLINNSGQTEKVFQSQDKIEKELLKNV